MTSRLILGTVQFGLSYGINNRRGQVSAEEVQQILARAHAAGIRTLDTAEAYGMATARIGEFHQTDAARFDVITKFKSDPNNPYGVDERLREELRKMHLDRATGYLFHSPEAMQSDPKHMRALVALRKADLIQHIGVSIYTNAQFECAIEHPEIGIIQLPYNVLDNRSQRGALIERAKAAGKVIHTRSVFLQGLFFKKPDKLPQRLLELRPALVAVRDVAHQYRLTTAQLCLSYALANPLIDGVLIGVDSLAQLEANLNAVATDLPTEAARALESIAVSNPALLNPSNWS